MKKNITLQFSELKPVAVFATVTLFLLLTCHSAWSQDSKDLEFTSTAEVERTVVNAQGEKEVRRIKAEKVLPGEEVIFTNAFVNTGAEPAENIVIHNPVPKHMTYVPGSAFGEKAEITFSADGGKTFDTPAQLTVPGPDGEPRRAEPEDYTHIRWAWQEPLPAGEQGQVGFKAELK